MNLILTLIFGQPSLLYPAHQTSDKRAKKKLEAAEQFRKEALELEQQAAAAAAAFQQFEQFAPLPPELVQSASLYEEHGCDDDSALEYGEV